LAHESLFVLKVLLYTSQLTNQPSSTSASFFYPRDVVSAVLAMATWLAGWLDVTCRYCIYTTKPVLKFFRPSGSPSF